LITNHRKPTQYDVARLAGVSQATVSQILNHSTTVSIPDETRQRVFAIMDQIGYIPSRSARSLRTKKSCTIATIIPDITNPFYPAFVRGIQDVTIGKGYDLIIYNTDGLESNERQCLLSMQQNEVDGAIIVPFHLTENDLLDTGTPIVQLIQKPEKQPKLDSIFVDNVSAAKTLVNHLLERGHTHIGMISGAEDLPPRYSRVLGYQQALAEHHIPLDEILIRGGDFTEQGGYQIMLEFLSLAQPVTAIFAANDLMAMGALIAIRDAGLKVPQDIAVAGFDDIPSARLVNPPLTTIRQFQHKMGQTTAEMLIERLNGQTPQGGRTVEMPYELVVRESA
jgi:LacI family transcriptional regulator